MNIICSTAIQEPTRYHASMEAYLAAQTSCTLLRLARRSLWPRLGPCAKRQVTFDHAPRSRWWRKVINELNPYLAIDARHPLCALVPTEARRSISPLVNTIICSGSLPVASFLTMELEGSDHIYALESPALSFLRMAQRLDRATRAAGHHVLSPLQARTLLLDYGCELCGTYARDPMDPWYGPCTYRLKPMTTPAEILAFCQAPEVARTRGVALARACATSIPAMAASPAEALLDIFFTTPPMLGGMGLPYSEVLVNATLPLTARERSLVHRTPLTPDLRFPALNLVIEHQGSGHADPSQYREDASRIQDYGALGLSVFTTSQSDLQTPAAFEAFLRRLVTWIAHVHGPDVTAPYQALLDDTRYRSARSDLVSTLMERRLDPWI